MTAPGSQTIAGALTLTVNLMQSGQPAAVVLGGSKTGFTAGSGTGNLWLNAAWNSLMKNAMTGDITCTGGTIRSLGGDGLVVELPAPTTPTGTGGAVGTFAAAAVLIKWNTANGSRSGKGRSFLPGVPTSAIVGGRTLATASQSQIQTQVGNYLSAMATGDAGAGIVTPCVISRKNGAAYPITSGTVSSIIGIQRRRMRA